MGSRWRGRVAAIAVVAVLAIGGGIAYVAAAPRVVNVCGAGAERCIGSAVFTDPSAEAAPALEVLPLEQDSPELLTLHNDSSVGTTYIGVVGYIERGTTSRFAPGPQQLDRRIELDRGESKEVRLQDVPKTAEAVLLQIGGTPPGNDSTVRDCRSGTEKSASCSYVSVSLLASYARVTEQQVRDALHRYAAIIARPAPTPTAVDRVTREINASTPTPGTPSPTPTPTPSLTPSATPSAPAPTQTAEPAPAPSAPAPVGSDTAMPVGDIPGWRQIIAQDFLRDAPLGQFTRNYPAYSGYDGVTDTSRDEGRAPGTAGLWNNATTSSVHDGVYDCYLHTEGITPQVCALTPTPNQDWWTGQLYGRYSVRFKIDPVPDYKIAWLLWPSSDRWDQGEIDFPEGDLDGTIYGSTHNVWGSPWDNQWFIDSGERFDVWHTATIEWRPGSITFILDGRSWTTTDPAGLPTNPMRWALQAETHISPTPPARDAAGHIYIDWIVGYSYVS